MSRFSDKIKKLPRTPGIYQFFADSGEILYVGKAASLKDRVKSYFVGKNSSRPIEQMIEKVANLKTRKTDTVIEAYFLEQELIKKYQPKYNVMGKDDKSANYACITKEEFPRIIIKRRTDLAKVLNKNGSINLQSASTNLKLSKIYGPYSSKNSIVVALKILRKIFPYHNRPGKTEKGCLAHQIGLCPGPYNGKISVKDYKKNIQGIEMMFKGKKKMLIKKLEKEMKEFSEKKEFERAAEKRNQIFALSHIQDLALINNESDKKLKAKSHKPVRIEAYDISNISGKFCVGSMVVFDNSRGQFEPNKSQYRKFKIKTVDGINDIAAMREMLLRRFQNDWPRPNLMILDGGMGHLNMAKSVLKEIFLRQNYGRQAVKDTDKIALVAVAKGPTRKNVACFKYRVLKRDVKEVAGDKKLLKQITDEAHRFAIAYHRKLREKSIK